MNTRLNIFFRSPTLRRIAIGIGVSALVLFIFQVGIIVGSRRAVFGYHWQENYRRNFGGERRGFLTLPKTTYPEHMAPSGVLSASRFPHSRLKMLLILKLAFASPEQPSFGKRMEQRYPATHSKLTKILWLLAGQITKERLRRNSFVSCPHPRHFPHRTGNHKIKDIATYYYS